jgi:hypothetical protein
MAILSSERDKERMAIIEIGQLSNIFNKNFPLEKLISEQHFSCIFPGA